MEFIHTHTQNKQLGNLQLHQFHDLIYKTLNRNAQEIIKLYVNQKTPLHFVLG